MAILLYCEDFLEHKPLVYHPERPERLKIVLKAIEEYEIPVDFEKPPREELEKASLVHDESYVRLVRDVLRGAPVNLDSDTYLSSGSLKSIQASIGASFRSVELAEEGRGPVFSLVRPPGHHAGIKGRAFNAPSLGFCVFNNLAISAKVLIRKGIRPIFVLDFDAHHGNGTQEIFYDERELVHVDLHQHPLTLYPGSGFPQDLGGGGAFGTKVNLILSPGAGDDAYDLYLREIIAPLAEVVRPKALLFSAGFDSYQGDGLASLRASSRTFHRLAVELLENLPDIPVVAFLEGGYSRGLSRGLPAFLAALNQMDDVIKDEPTRSRNLEEEKRTVRFLREVLSTIWELR